MEDDAANISARPPTLLVPSLNQWLRESKLNHWRSRAPSALETPASAREAEVTLPGLICQSAAMRRIVTQVHAMRESHMTVLINGESGTGKEVIARAIHTLSRRSAAPFAPFNCAAVPGELIESHLFGHRRGAFTGASANHLGVIRTADGGTLFLDEIGELALSAQPKLLRFLEQREIQPLGESKPRLVDVRVIAATNRNLEDLVAAEKFRADLYHRLNVIELHLPPLRERPEDIPLLLDHFLSHYSAESGKEGIIITGEATELLMHYDWPGNVRQLQHEIQRIVALIPPEEEITAEMLSPRVRQNQRHSPPTSPLPSRPPSLAAAVAELERQMIRAALAQHKGNLSRTANELRITRATLRLKKIKQYGLRA
jgi:transcriptional regulator with PAS, ATPase and Fis domain